MTQFFTVKQLRDALSGLPGKTHVSFRVSRYGNDSEITTIPLGKAQITVPVKADGTVNISFWKDIPQ